MTHISFSYEAEVITAKFTSKICKISPHQNKIIFNITFSNSSHVNNATDYLIFLTFLFFESNKHTYLIIAKNRIQVDRKGRGEYYIRHLYTACGQVNC